MSHFDGDALCAAEQQMKENKPKKQLQKNRKLPLQRKASKSELKQRVFSSICSALSQEELNESADFKDAMVPLQGRQGSDKSVKRADDQLRNASNKGESVDKPDIRVMDDEFDQELDDKEEEKRKCPSCLIFVSKIRLHKHVKECLQRRFKAPTESMPVENLADQLSSDEALANELQSEEGRECEKHSVGPEMIFCQICQKELSHMNSLRRAQHVNRCIDKVEEEKKEREKEQLALERAHTAILSCPMCGKPFKTDMARKTHLKKCAKQYSVLPDQLLQLVQKQKEEHELLLAAHFVPRVEKATSRKTGLAAGLDREKRVKKVKREQQMDEDIQLAMVMSTSLLEEQKKQEEQLVQTVQGIRQGLDRNMKKEKRSKRRTAENPLLLRMTDDDWKNKYAERVAIYIISQRVELENLSVVKLPPSRLAASAMQNCRPWTVLGNGEGINASGDFQTSSQWARCSLRESHNMFYVKQLMPPIKVDRVQAGSKLKRLSAIPGQHLTKSNQQTTSILEEDGNKSDSQAGPASQTALLLAELAAEAEVEAELEVDHSKCRDANYTMGFCPEQIIEIKEEIKNKMVTTLNNSLLRLVGDSDHSDLVIQTAEGQRIFGHSFLIGLRCPELLKKQSFSDDESIIYLRNASCDVAMVMLKYLYAGKLEVCRSQVSDLLTLAEELKLNELTDLCECLGKDVPPSLSSDPDSMEETSEQFLHDSTMKFLEFSHDDDVSSENLCADIMEFESDELDDIYCTQRKNMSSHKEKHEEVKSHYNSSIDLAVSENEIYDEGGIANGNDIEDEELKQKRSGTNISRELFSDEETKFQMIDDHFKNLSELPIRDRMFVAENAALSREKVKTSPSFQNKLNFKTLPKMGLNSLEDKLNDKTDFSDPVAKDWNEHMDDDSDGGDILCQGEMIRYDKCGQLGAKDTKDPSEQLDQIIDVDIQQVDNSGSELPDLDNGETTNFMNTVNFSEAGCESLNTDSYPVSVAVDLLSLSCNEGGDSDSDVEIVEFKPKLATSSKSGFVCSGSEVISDATQKKVSNIEDNSNSPSSSCEVEQISHSLLLSQVNLLDDVLNLSARQNEPDTTACISSNDGITLDFVHKSCDKPPETSENSKNKTAETSMLSGHSLETRENCLEIDPARLSVCERKRKKTESIEKFERCLESSQESMTTDQTKNSDMVLINSGNFHKRKSCAVDGSTLKPKKYIFKKRKLFADKCKQPNRDETEKTWHGAIGLQEEGCSIVPKSAFSEAVDDTETSQESPPADLSSVWDDFDDCGFVDDVFNESFLPNEVSPKTASLHTESSVQVVEMPDINRSPDCADNPGISYPFTPILEYETMITPEVKTNRVNNQRIPSPFTPMPDYDAMTTPQLNSALKKYGIKKLPKKKMMVVLKDIFHQTHQYETDSEFERSASNLDFNKKELCSQSAEHRADANLKDCSESEEASSQTSSDQDSSSENNVLHMVLEESYIANEETSSQQDFTSNVQKKLAELIRTKPEIYKKILMYQPLEFDWLRKLVTEAGIKCSVAKLLDFLDEQCITFSMKGKQKGSWKARVPKVKKK